VTSKSRSAKKTSKIRSYRLFVSSQESSDGTHPIQSTRNTKCASWTGSILLHLSLFLSFRRKGEDRACIE
jgi:hypothetical protein